MVRFSLGSAASGLDNPGLYQRVREAVRSADATNAGKLSRAQGAVWSYQSAQAAQRRRIEQQEGEGLGDAEDTSTQPINLLVDADGQPAPEEERAALEQVKAQVIKDSHDEYAEWKHGPVGSSRGGYAGHVDDQIEAARRKGLFKNNKWRGKPLIREVDEMNPFLKREEFLMNRIIKRQGSAPPWVELNAEVEREIQSFRSRLADSWIRRASRMIGSTESLRRDCDPLPLHISQQAQQVRDETERLSALKKTAKPPCADAAALSHLEAFVSSPTSLSGHAMLLETCKSYRDAAWREKEHKFHWVEIHDLNIKIRRYNGLAPYHARKAMLDREYELEKLYSKAAPRLAIAVSHELRGGSPAADGSSASSSSAKLTRTKPSFDFWGNEIITAPPAAVEPVQTNFFDLQPVRSAPDGTRAEAVVDPVTGERTQPSPSAAESSDGLSLLHLLRRTKDWVRSRVGV